MSEQINVTDGTVLESLNDKVDLDGGNYVGSGFETRINNKLGGLTFWKGTQSEYEALSKDENTLYFIKGD